MHTHHLGERGLLAKPRLAIVGPGKPSPQVQARTSHLLRACVARGIVAVVPHARGFGRWCAQEAVALGAGLILILAEADAASVGGTEANPLDPHQNPHLLLAHLAVEGEPAATHDGPEVAELVLRLTHAVAVVGLDVNDPTGEALVNLALSRRVPTCILPAAIADGGPDWSQAALRRGAQLMQKNSDLDWLARLGHA